jgi:hypothetical protein
LYDAHETETAVSPTPGTETWKHLAAKIAINEAPDEDDWRALGHKLHELQAAHPMKPKKEVKKVPLLWSSGDHTACR